MDPTPDSIPSSSSPLAPLQPLLNPKYRHISRSAAKRESVQLLGSIKGLQLHFARAGLVEHRAGSGAGVRGLGSLGEDEENQPPTEAEHRRTKMRKPWKEVDLQRVDVNAARREARGLVGIVRGIWGLDLPLSPSVSTLAIFPGSPAKAAERDTRTTLTTTAQAIRRIRSLALAVSHTSHPRMGERRTSTPSLHPPRPSSGRASISTPSRPGVLPRAVTYAAGQRKSSLGPLEEVDAGADFLGDLRKGALEVLAGLRGLEEHLRVDLEHPPPRAHPSLSSSSPFESSFTAPTSLRPGSSCSVSEQEEYSDDEENYSLNALAQSSAEIESVETWEERIVSEGREYHALNEEGEKERSVVKSVEKWIAAVEKTFAVGYVQESEVEQWAKEIWDGEVIGRSCC